MFRVAESTIFGFIPVKSTAGLYARSQLGMAGEAFLGDNFQVIVMTLGAVLKSRGNSMSCTHRARSIIDGILLLRPEESRNKNEDRPKEFQLVGIYLHPERSLFVLFFPVKKFFTT